MERGHDRLLHAVSGRGWYEAYMIFQIHYSGYLCPQEYGPILILCYPQDWMERSLVASQFAAKI